MRAEHREARQYPGIDRSALNLRAAATACKFRIKEISPDFARLHCPLNIWSFGETIRICVGEVDRALLLDISSACCLPTQVFDWGKNAKNVRRLFEAIERQLVAPTAAVSPICSDCGYLLAGSHGGVCPECGRQAQARAPRRSKLLAQWRSAAVFMLALTAIEILLLFVLGRLGFDAWPLRSGAEIRGIAIVAVFNAVLLGVLILVALIWKPNR